MPDREKVIKGLEHCFENGCSDCPYVENCVIYEEYFSETLIKDVLELLKEQENSGWISVNDRMPPAGKVLLVARKYKEPGIKEIRYVEIGELMDDCTWLSDSDEYKINRKYHSQPYAWMPLPEPPKEKNDAVQGKSD